jgi:hypothetical protein
MTAYRRLQDAGQAVSALDMPEVSYGMHIINWLFEAGPGNDGKPITWPDLKSWRDMTGTRVNPSEAMALRQLSCEYMAELNSARNPDRCAPNGDKTVENMNGLLNALRKLKG